MPYAALRDTMLDCTLQTETDFKALRGQLIGLAARGLEDMFDFEKGLFCFRAKPIRHGTVKEGLSLRYTLISLLGLHRLENGGRTSAFDVQSAFNTLLKRSYSIDKIGDLGLLIWLCALVSPEQLTKICSAFDLERSLTRFQDARLGLTTELSWFLTGLCYSVLAAGDIKGDVNALIRYTYRLIRDNYAGQGIFRHSKRNSFQGMIRSRIGCFADQVYPIFGFTALAEAHGVKEAYDIALGCAKTLARLQGPLGQWWWHYDALTGKVLGKYPVFSVHQDAMAPMALLAIGDTSGVDFMPPVLKGMKWLLGSNELGHRMIDSSRNIIFRSLFTGRITKYSNGIRSLLRLNPAQTIYSDLQINHECRPYHLGWILYALAGKDNDFF